MYQHQICMSILTRKLPDAIIGDLDSILPSVRQHYEKLGVPIMKDPDQYSTDFTKCLKHINENASEIIKSPRKTARKSSNNHDDNPTSPQTLEIVILGGLGGRVDQAFSQIHHLYMMTQSQRQLQEAQQSKNVENKDAKSATGGDLYLVSEESITFVLQKGKNTIQTPSARRPGTTETTSSQQENADPTRKRKRDQDLEQEYLFEENIGIIPLSAPASITTHGFEWDVQDWHTEIGGQLSTSNHIRADTVSVETSVPVLFTVELAQRLKR